MKLFDGLDKSDYQDVLRAIGRLADEHKYRDIRLIETDDGIIMQGRSRFPDTESSGGYETTFFTEHDMQTILTESYKLRQKPAMPKQTDAARTSALLLRKIKDRGRLEQG